jgi:hypothetical protein
VYASPKKIFRWADSKRSLQYVLSTDVPQLQTSIATADEDLVQVGGRVQQVCSGETRLKLNLTMEYFTQTFSTISMQIIYTLTCFRDVPSEEISPILRQRE